MVHFSPIQSILSYLIHFGLFGLIWSTLILFYPLQFYLVNIGPIGPLCPLQSYSNHLVYFGFIWSILSTSILFGRHWTYSAHFFPICSYSVQSVDFSLIQSTLVLFSPLRSNLVIFGPICSHSIHYVHFGPNLCILSYSVRFGPPYSHSKPILSTWSNSIYLCPLR